MASKPSDATTGQVSAGLKDQGGQLADIRDAHKAEQGAADLDPNGEPKKTPCNCDGPMVDRYTIGYLVFGFACGIAGLHPGLVFAATVGFKLGEDAIDEAIPSLPIRLGGDSKQSALADVGAAGVGFAIGAMVAKK